MLLKLQKKKKQKKCLGKCYIFKFEINILVGLHIFY